ncbi:unnamed protein product, partial [Ectocarpus sp. 12 AP-2014]
KQGEHGSSGSTAVKEEIPAESSQSSTLSPPPPAGTTAPVAVAGRQEGGEAAAAAAAAAPAPSLTPTTAAQDGAEVSKEVPGPEASGSNGATTIAAAATEAGGSSGSSATTTTTTTSAQKAGSTTTTATTTTTTTIAAATATAATNGAEPASSPTPEPSPAANKAEEAALVEKAKATAERAREARAAAKKAAEEAAEAAVAERGPFGLWLSVGKTFREAMDVERAAAAGTNAADGGADGTAQRPAVKGAPVPVRDLGREGERILQWHVSNVEYSTGATSLDDLSLRHWEADGGDEFDGPHSLISEGYGSLADHIATQVRDVRLGWAVTRIEHARNPRPTPGSTGTGAAADAGGKSHPFNHVLF